MVADQRKMQENQWISEIRIDKFRFVLVIILLLTDVVNYLALEAEGGASLRSASFPALFLFQRNECAHWRNRGDRPP